jgi:hypothetical protein
MIRRSVPLAVPIFLPGDLHQVVDLGFRYVLAATAEAVILSAIWPRFFDCPIYRPGGRGVGHGARPHFVGVDFWHCLTN